MWLFVSKTIFFLIFHYSIPEFQVQSMDLWGSERPFHKIHAAKALFLMIRRYLPFACVDICTNGAEAEVGEIAGALTQARVLALN